MTCEISRNRSRAIINKQKTATKIMNRSLPTNGSIKRLTLVVPELQSVAKHAAEDIYKHILNLLFVFMLNLYICN
jgi:hypothetical protein